jgi:hypothetical protein
MRLIGAGLFVFAGLLASVAGIGALDIFDRAPPWVGGTLTLTALVVFVIAAAWLFNMKSSYQSLDQQLEELEDRGLLTSTEYHATRAFGVDEFEDEGLSYFLELTDGRVLFLSGQYLYECEPDAEEKRARTFPCSDFSIRRHKSENYVVDVECRGRILEPEAIAKPFIDTDWKNGRVPEDGDVISTRTYDAIKTEQLSR